MSQQSIGIGSSANDGTGDPLRTAFDKSNKNFTELYAQGQPLYTTNASRWWSPVHGNQMSGGASAPGTGTMKLFPGFVGSQLTLSNLGARVSTLSAAGNFQLAIYAANANNYPTGTALVSTASISTGATGFQSSAASLQLGPGLYWFACNQDNGTVIFNSFSATGLFFPQVIGNQGNTAAVTSTNGLTIAQTFGTWPDLTATSWASANENGSSNMPAIVFQIASIP